MQLGSTKEKLRVEYLKPKRTLQGERNRRQWTTAYAGGLIGVSRRQYELKEKGVYPFNDYEMYILAEALGMPIESLFFDK